MKKSLLKRKKYGRAAWYSFGRALLLRFLRYLVVKYKLDYVGLIEENKEEWKNNPRYTLIMCSDDDSYEINEIFEEFATYEKLIQAYDVYNYGRTLRKLDIFPVLDAFLTKDKKDEKCSILIYKDNPDEVVFKKSGQTIKDGIPRKNKVKKLEERAMLYGKEVEY